MAKFEYLYIFVSVFATSANLEGQKFSQIRRENSAISLVEIRALIYIYKRPGRDIHVTAVQPNVQQHRGKTSAHAPNYENMAGNLNINF